MPLFFAGGRLSLLRNPLFWYSKGGHFFKSLRVFGSMGGKFFSGMNPVIPSVHEFMAKMGDENRPFRV
jgi:hypothetical protein